MTYPLETKRRPLSVAGSKFAKSRRAMPDFGGVPLPKRMEAKALLWGHRSELEQLVLTAAEGLQGNPRRRWASPCRF